MADQSFIEEGGKKDARDVGFSYKIRKIGFPIAVVLCLILLIVCIVLAVLYSKAVSKPVVTTPKEAKYEICQDESCFHLGMDMAKTMDKTVDSCKDFYAYVCQGWQSRNPAKNGSNYPISKAPSHIFDFTYFKNAFESPKSNYSQYPFIQKAIRFYESCINTTAADARGLQPLKDLIEDYGGWSVFSSIDPSVSLPTRIGKILRELGVDTLLPISVIGNSTKRTLLLKEPELGMSRKSYLERNRSNKEQQAYIRLLITVGRMATGSSSADSKMMAIYHFEKSIAKIFRDKNATASRRVSTTFTGNEEVRLRRSTDSQEEPQMSLLAFCKATGMPWSFLGKTLGIIFARNFSGSAEIILHDTNTKAFQEFYSLLQKTNESVVVDYIMYHVLRKYYKAIPAIYNSSLTILGLDEEVKPRWKICLVDEMLSPFAMVLNLLFIDLQGFLGKGSKEKVEEMTENIRFSFIEGLKEATWMDSSTIENAKEKALAMRTNIAYPPYIKNPSDIKKRYESLHITDNFFSNFKAISHFNKMENLNTYDSPVNKSEWATDEGIYMTNAFYRPFDNKIVVPAGIILPPFYGPDFPRYLTYSGVGGVIGHEITHGFDGAGRTFDKNGKQRDWWSKSSSESFKQKAKCFEKQYDQFSFYGVKVNGTMTLNENIADNGGIRIAYEAYKRWTQENGVEKILPGLTFSPDQLFFIGYAKGWCKSYSETSAAHHVKRDPVHTFPKFRVNGPLANFDKFSDAFKCPANSPMNPSSKCVIW